MRILYGVFGYGRGHATRALSVLPELRERHEVLLLAGGDAYDAIAPEHPVVRVPTLRYEYATNGNACPGCWAECEVMPSAIYTGDLVRRRTTSRGV